MADPLLPENAIANDHALGVPPPGQTTQSLDDEVNERIRQFLLARIPNVEVEHSIELVSLDYQHAPLLRLGPIDVRAEIKLNVKLGTGVESQPDKIIIKTKDKAVGFEKDIPLPKSVENLIKEVKISSEYHVPLPGDRQDGATGGWVKLLGIEVTPNLSLLVACLRSGHAAKKEPHRTIYDFYLQTTEVEEKTGEPKFEFKTEVSLNLDIEQLLSQPERVVTLQSAFKHPEISLGGFLEWFIQRRRPKFKILEDNLIGRALKAVNIEPEINFVVNLNGTGWTALGGAAGWGGVRHLAWQALRSAQPIVRSMQPLITGALTSTPFLVATGTILGAGTTAVGGAYLLGREHLFGRNKMIGNHFIAGYTKQLADAIDFSREELISTRASRYANPDWQKELAEVSDLIHGAGGQVGIVFYSRACDRLKWCGGAAALDQLQGALGNEVWDFWPAIQHLHRTRAGATADKRRIYYLQKLQSLVQLRNLDTPLEVLPFNP